MTRILTTFAALLLALPLWASVPLGDDGLHKPAFLRETFKDLREDLEEAQGEGRTLMVILEQRGCIYCKRMHEEVFVDPEIEALIEEKYFVVQMDLRGGVEVTDFDGTTLPESEMADFWGLRFTPTMMLFPDPVEDGTEAPKAAAILIPGALDVPRTLSLLLWGSDAQAREMSLEEFHAARLAGE